MINHFQKKITEKRTCGVCQRDDQDETWSFYPGSRTWECPPCRKGRPAYYPATFRRDRSKSPERPKKQETLTMKQCTDIRDELERWANNERYLPKFSGDGKESSWFWGFSPVSKSLLEFHWGIAGHYPNMVYPIKEEKFYFVVSTTGMRVFWSFSNLEIQRDGKKWTGSATSAVEEIKREVDMQLEEDGE